jgi:hypothetical protein
MAEPVAGRLLCILILNLPCDCGGHRTVVDYRIATRGVEAKMSRLLSYLARTGAYLITFLLALVWIAAALDSLLHPPRS